MDAATYVLIFAVINNVAVAALLLHADGWHQIIDLDVLVPIFIDDGWREGSLESLSELLAVRDNLLYVFGLNVF